MATPIKINNVGGDEIKEFTTAEENYIAYQIGLHLSSDSANGIGGITTNSGHTSIGTYTNTFFNEPVGTHPSTSITEGSTTTTLYQNQGTAATETDSDVKLPLMWIDAGGETGFKQMTSSDLNTAVERYLTTIFTNDYPGVFKLGSSSPGGDYSVWLSSVFTDTRTDGTSVTYNIYRRDSYSDPGTTRPLFVRDSGGFDGIQAMTDRQIKYSFGQRAKSRIGASKIGTYQIRSATAGAPTDPGTWVSAGAATDTKQTTSDQSFTTVFTAQYATTYTRGYTGVFSGSYTINYTSTYAKAYTGNAFVTNYTRSFLRQQSESFGRNYTRVYTGNFTSNYVRAYTPNYVRRYTGNYLRNYNRGYTISYASLAAISYEPTGFVALYAPRTTPNYPLGIEGLQVYGAHNVVGVLSTNYTGNPGPRGDPYFGPSRNDQGLPLEMLGVLYGGQDIRWLLNDEVTVVYPYIPDSSNIYELGGVKTSYGVGGPKADIYANPGPQVGAGLVGYLGDSLMTDPQSEYVRAEYSIGAPFRGQPVRYIISYDSPAQVYVRSITEPFYPLGEVASGSRGAPEQKFLLGAYISGGATTWKVYISPAAGDINLSVGRALFVYQNTFFGGSPGNIAELGSTNRVWGYLGGYLRDVAQNYDRNFATDYNRNFVRNTDVGYVGAVFSAAYQKEFLNNFNAQYLRNYTGLYSSVYTGGYTRAYTPNYTTDYARNYIGDYTSAYTRVFDAPYTQAYIRAYTGNFEGLTIDATSETNETYTLYVRIS